MNIDKILQSPLINTAELARRMWPNAKEPKSRLAHKIAGSYGQRVTDKDRQMIEVILLELFS